MDTEINLIINELQNTGIKIKIPKKLLLKRAKQQLEKKKQELEHKILEENRKQEIEQKILEEKKKQEVEQEILEDNKIKLENAWLIWIINVSKNHKKIGWNYIFETLYNECSLIDTDSNMYKDSFYKNLVSHLYVYGYLHNFKKNLLEYTSLFEYKYSRLKITPFTAPEVKTELRKKTSLLSRIDITINQEINNRKNKYKQLEYGYIGYILFREKKFNKIPLIIENIISEFIIGYNYRIKRIK